MPIGFIQSIKNDFATRTSFTLALPVNVVAGDLIVVRAQVNLITNVSAISDNLNGGQTWSKDAYQTSGAQEMYTWSAIANASGACTITVSDLIAVMGGTAETWRTTTSWVGKDQANNNHDTGTGPSITTTHANEVIVAAFASGGLALVGINAPFATRQIIQLTSTTYHVTGDMIVTATGTYNAVLNPLTASDATIVSYYAAADSPAGATISGLSFSVSDTTIVATWTTSVAVDSYFTAGGKTALDQGLATFGTSHQAIVTGLTPSTVYSCVVSTADGSSTPQNVTTNAAPTRIPIISVAFGSPTVKSLIVGDTVYTFVSNDNITYNTMDDGNGWGGGSSYAQQIDKLSNESTLVGTNVNLMTNYGVSGIPHKLNGLFGMSGSLYAFQSYITAAGPQQEKYGNVIQSNDKGATWNNWQNPGVFNANGVLQIPVTGMSMFDRPNLGWAVPVRYAKDDGTLGYLTAGNRIDGADGFVYITLLDSLEQNNSDIYLCRIPRAQLAVLGTAFQYWKGPTSPTPADFVNDANWQGSAASITSIYHAANQISAPDMIFIPTLNRYLLLTFYYPNIATTSDTIWVILESPTPAGPWTQVGTQENNPAGYYSEYVQHRTAAENTLRNSVPLQLIYTGDYNNQPTYYHPTYSTLTLTTQVFTVSGNAGVAGATVSYIGAESGSVVADGSGDYSLPNLPNGSYTITPSKTGYSFSPSNSAQTVSGADISGVDFTATKGSGGFDFRFRC